MNPMYFGSPAQLRDWFRQHAANGTELHVGYHKKATGEPSITWPESVDEALCVGWIDGVRRSVDERRYTVRFTPRKKGSIWSAVNIRRVEVLTGEGRMTPAGLLAFEARRENRSGIYAYEQPDAALAEPFAARLMQNAAAWTFFQAQPPSYRKKIGWWLASAKQETTRLKRLKKLIDESARQRRL